MLVDWLWWLATTAPALGSIGALALAGTVGGLFTSLIPAPYGALIRLAAPGLVLLTGILIGHRMADERAALAASQGEARQLRLDKASLQKDLSNVLATAADAERLGKANEALVGGLSEQVRCYERILASRTNSGRALTAVDAEWLWDIRRGIKKPSAGSNLDGLRQPCAPSEPAEAAPR